MYGIAPPSLRLTNTYGPGVLVKHTRQGFIAWFIRKAVEGGEIEIFGDGSQMRDMNYVDDVVDAFLLAAADERANGQIYNLAGDPPVAPARARGAMVEIAGRGSLPPCRSRPRRSASTSAATSGPPR